MAERSPASESVNRRDSPRSFDGKTGGAALTSAPAANTGRGSMGYRGAALHSLSDSAWRHGAEAGRARPRPTASDPGRLLAAARSAPAPAGPNPAFAPADLWRKVRESAPPVALPAPYCWSPSWSSVGVWLTGRTVAAAAAASASTWCGPGVHKLWMALDRAPHSARRAAASELHQPAQFPQWDVQIPGLDWVAVRSVALRIPLRTPISPLW